MKKRRFGKSRDRRGTTARPGAGVTNANTEDGVSLSRTPRAHSAREVARTFGRSVSELRERAARARASPPVSKFCWSARNVRARPETDSDKEKGNR